MLMLNRCKSNSYIDTGTCHSNTTYVNVKLFFLFFIRLARSYSNTTYVNVKHLITSPLSLHSGIQIQPMLMLNYRI